MLNHGEEFKNGRYEGISRTGVVVARRADQHGPRVRIQYPDRRVASAWIPVSQRNTIGSADYGLPRIGEQVLVNHLANGPERAVVVGCLFTERTSAPVQGNIDNRYVKFDDGTTVEYDPGAKAMTIKAAGSLSITTASPITVNAPEVSITANVKIKGNLSVEGDITNTGNMTTGGAHTDSNGKHC